MDTQAVETSASRQDGIGVWRIEVDSGEEYWLGALDGEQAERRLIETMPWYAGRLVACAQVTDIDAQSLRLDDEAEEAEPELLSYREYIVMWHELGLLFPEIICTTAVE